MSLLDEEFGPREEDPEMKARLDALKNATHDERMLSMLQAGTLWHCEEAIKPGLNAFISEMGLEYIPLGDFARRSLYASARPIVAEVGEVASAEFVTWACREAKNKGTEIKDLRSLMYLIPAWRKRYSEPLHKPCPECFQVGSHADDCLIGSVEDGAHLY